jgi:pilus assembly protein CpaF
MNMSNGTVSRGVQDRILIEELRTVVGDELHRVLQAEQNRGKNFDEADKRQLTETFTIRRLEDRNKLALQHGRQLLSDAEIRNLAREVVALMHGAGGLEAILAMPNMTDAFVWWDRAIIELSDGRRLHLGAVSSSEEAFNERLRDIAANHGRSSHLFDPLHVDLSMELKSGGARLSAVRSVSDSTTVSIRRSVMPDVDFPMLIAKGTFTEDAAVFMQHAVVAELNLMIGGGTGAGKTTFLRACTHYFGVDERILTIEDASELHLHQSRRLRNVVSYESRAANSEGKGAYTLGQAADHALRMSPKRIIVGETRNSTDILPLLGAMSSGNEGSMGTIHASSAENIIGKMKMYVMMSPQQFSAETAVEMIANSVELLVHLHRLRTKDGTERRVVTSIREIVGSNGVQVSTNEIFRRENHQLVATGVCSDGLLDRLVDVGMDPRVVGKGRR